MGAVVWSRSSVVRASAAKAGGPGFDPWQLPWVFFSSSWLTNVDEMKDLWCSSTAAINTDMNWIKDLWCSSTVRLLSTQI